MTQQSGFGSTFNAPHEVTQDVSAPLSATRPLPAGADRLARRSPSWAGAAVWAAASLWCLIGVPDQGPADQSIAVPMGDYVAVFGDGPTS
jgi:hypothetical protein